MGLYAKVATSTEAGPYGEYNKGPRVGNQVITFLNNNSIPFNGSGDADVSTFLVDSNGGLTSAIQNAVNAGEPASVFLEPGPSYNYSSEFGNGALVPEITGSADVSIIALDSQITITYTGSGNILFTRVPSTTASLNLSGLRFVDFDNSGSQGGVLRNAGTLSVLETEFENNAADDGGAIFNAGSGTATLVRPSFRLNDATNAGGALYNAGTLEVIDYFSNLSNYSASTRETFFDNGAGLQGGAIFNSGTLTLNNALFYDNIVGSSGTGGQGGGIYNSGTLTDNGSTLWDNASTEFGGGLYNTGTATIDDALLTDNKAGPQGLGTTIEYGSGAAIYNTDTGNVTVTDTEISTNNSFRGSETAAQDDTLNGGAIDTTGNLSLTQTIVEGNAILYDADDLGQGVEGDDSDADVVSDGAALYVHGSNSLTVTVDDSCITGNLSIGFQGILNQNASTTVQADEVWWGNSQGPTLPGADVTDPTQQRGDQVSTGVNFTNIITDRNVIFYEDCDLSVFPAVNDGFVNAVELPLLDASPNFTTTDSTVNEDDPQPSSQDISDGLCQVTDRSIWYSYTPPTDYSVDIEAQPYDNGTTDAQIIFSVWTGTRDTLAPADPTNYCAFADDSPATLEEELQLNGGTTYYIMVGTWQSPIGGTSTLSVQPEVPQKIYPGNNEQIDVNFPLYEWTTVGYAESYTVTVTEEGATSPRVEVTVPAGECGANTCTVQPNIPLGNAFYEWSVTANYNNGTTLEPYPSATTLFEVTRYRWDIDADNDVDATDVQLVIDALGTEFTGAIGPEDVTGDGLVTPADAIEVINRQGDLSN